MLRVIFGSVGLRFQADFVAHLERCRDDLLVQRRSTKNTSERVFSSDSVVFSVINLSSGRSGVRISNIVQVKNVQFKSDKPHKPVLPGTSRRIPSACKGQKRTTSSLLLNKKKFLFANCSPLTSRKFNSLEEPSFEASLVKNFERAGTRKNYRDRRADPIFQMSR